MKEKKILYFDMDSVIVDFQSGIDALSADIRESYAGRIDEVPHIFALMKPIEGGIEAFSELSEYYDCYLVHHHGTTPQLQATKLNGSKNTLVMLRISESFSHTTKT